MIPVLTLDRAERALPLAKALQEGGLPLMEIMFRSDAAADSIRMIAEQLPGFLVGAGTVLTVEQARRAVKCGAQFLVAPGFDPEVCETALELGVPVVPGCVTPTEVAAARKLGLKVLKFFPAVQNGGVPAMRLLAGPYPDIRFVPTGDLTRALAAEYLQFDKVAAAGGDFMLKYADIYSDNYAAVRADVRKTLEDYLNFHLIRAAAPGERGQELAALGPLGSLFGGGARAGDSGAAGCLDIGTRDLKRACAWLERCGLGFEAVTKTEGGSGAAMVCLRAGFNGQQLRLIQD